MILEPNDKLWYLASPYSHHFVEVQAQRYHQICKIAAYLIKEGFHIFSPIAHTHGIAVAGSLDVDFEYWRRYDELMLQASSGMIIATIIGWNKSKGIAEEIKICQILERPILLFDPFTHDFSKFNV